MKVLITTDWYAPVINGVVTSVLMLRRELEARGHEVRIVTLSNSMHSYKDGNVYYMGSVSANRIYPGARLKMNRAGSLLRELADWQPDVIHSQCEFSTFRVASALSNRLGTPIVHTYHTVYEDYTHYLYLSRRVGRYVVTAFSRWICGHTACIVAPTRKVEQLLRRYGVHCRIEVIPTGVDLRSFRENDNPQAREALRRQWNIPQDHTILLYLGRMAKEKNLETLIDQIADAGRQDVTLLLVGDGPDREAALESSQAAAGAGYIHRHGPSRRGAGLLPAGRHLRHRLHQRDPGADLLRGPGRRTAGALPAGQLCGRRGGGRGQRLAV